MCQEKKPHVHAALIKAWADGAHIQRKFPMDSEWEDCESPSWTQTTEYRIKPEKKSLGLLCYQAYFNTQNVGIWNQMSNPSTEEWENTAQRFMKSLKEEGYI